MTGQQRRKLIISPRTAGIIGTIVTAVLAYAAVATIDQGRTTARAQWRLAVTVGASTSIGLFVVLAAILAVARWRRRSFPLVARVFAGLAGALGLITVAALHTVGNGGPPSRWEVGLAAFLLPVSCQAVLLIPLLTWRRRPPDGAGLRHLIAVTITARKGGGWEVRWSGMGRTPAASHAPTLVGAVDQVLVTAPHLRARGAIELRIAIHPGPYRGGPSFDITGEPGDLIATPVGLLGQEVRGGTVEDLIPLIEQSLTDRRRGFRLRWTRVITAPRLDAS